MTRSVVRFFACLIAVAFIAASGCSRSLAKPTRPSGASLSDAQVIDIIRALPPWPYAGEPDYTTQDWEALVRAARTCQQVKPAVMRRTLREFVASAKEGMSDDGKDLLIEDWSRPLILLRVMFAVPEGADYRRYAPEGPMAFAAYMWEPLTHEGRPEPTTMATPVTWRDGTPALTARLAGYSGPMYEADGEYDFFRKTFPFRDLSSPTLLERIERIRESRPAESRPIDAQGP